MAVKTSRPMSQYIIKLVSKHSIDFIIRSIGRLSGVKIVDSTALNDVNSGETTMSGGAVKEFDFNRAMIASRFGVQPSEVTDEFLKSKLVEARRVAQAHFAAREKQLGVKIAPDTPQARRRIMKAAQKIIAATPK